MNVEGKHYRTIWLKEEDESVVQIIDQRKLPHEFVVEDLRTLDDVATAISTMQVRGAGLIGATAGYGMYIAALAAPDARFAASMNEAYEKILNTRPTAVNLKAALDRQIAAINEAASPGLARKAALRTAKEIADEDAEYCRCIGEYGLPIIKEISERKRGEPVNIATHCNAGWLAFVDYGSALSPVYLAHDLGIKVHVWVDETRPRNQGAALTAWELGMHGVPHTVIADNANGHIMQHGLVDMAITGADRVTRTGDAANKIGTYPKALAAAAHKIPFYVAFPSSTFDWSLTDGVRQIPIEERSPDEVRYIRGLARDGITTNVLLTPEKSQARNWGFDVTPRDLITGGLITERGICKADEKSILALFPERAALRGKAGR